jgi:flagellar biosynthetic protein FlhB
VAQESSGEKTEKASAKKRRESRERGQVLKSTEVNTVFCSAVMFGLMLLMLTPFVSSVMELLRGYLGAGGLILAAEETGPQAFGGVFTGVLLRMSALALPVLLTALAAGVAINVLQVGFLFTTKALAPKFERISPLKGFKRIFSVRTLTELVKSLLKVTVIGWIVYSDYVPLMNRVPAMMEMSLYAAFLETLRRAFTLAMKCTGALAIIAAADFLFQWWKHEKDLMMTKQEVKDEMKLTEGNPQIKGRIRQKQRQMSAMRMMEKVPNADVVITNPTHYAVALKYVEGQDGAPVVVAKGRDYLAAKIRQRAAEHNVEILEDRQLARALYAVCEVGDEIPPEFYQAVAVILRYVYGQRSEWRELDNVKRPAEKNGDRG